MRALPQHAPMRHWPVVDNCLVVGGIPLTRIAERAGRTPFYVYDRAAITERVAALRQHLPATVKLHYAIKANPMPALVGHIARLVDGLDVASAAEMGVALDAGADPENVSFAGPGKTELELAQAAAAGVLINIESAREVEVLERITAECGYPARVAVRVNPDFELKSSGMQMGGGPKQFGIDAEQVPAVLERIEATSRLRLEGFHIYTGSQNLRPHAISEAQERAIELALRLAAPLTSQLRVINIGGGFGIPYFPGDEPIALKPIGKTLQRLAAVVSAHLSHAAIVIELGRYIVGEAGLYVCRVIERKVSRGQVFLITDGGMHHHLAASGNFGQVLRKNYPVVIGNRVTGDTTEKASAVGPLCTPLDLLADQMELPQAQAGDLVAVFQSGAYGLSASPTAFLGHPRPAELIV